MFDWTDLVQTIKRIVKETVDAGQPSDFCYGVVVSEKPLKIQLEQKMTLGTAQLVLTRNVTDFETKLTIDGIQRDVTIRNSLKNGDGVALIKAKGGQKYLVLDRVVNT